MANRHLLGMFVSWFLAAAWSCPVWAQEPVSRFGPAAQPDSFPDYGGTPDLRVAPELGLSASELDVLLARLSRGDANERAKAVAEVLSSPPGSEQTLRNALWKPSAISNEALKGAMKDAVRRGKDGDALDGLLSASNNEAARTALRLVALLRALAARNTMAAYKTLIDFSPRHAGILRAEIGRLMTTSRLEALPALVYCRAHPDQETRMFCVRWIRDMGDPLLSEQVLGINEPRRLAQLLEAYGAVNDLDAIDVTLSLTNHPSLFVRRAARACIAKYGNNAKWGVMRAYENNLGKEPDEGAEVENLISELYAHYDSTRLSKVHARLEQAEDLRKSGELKEMAVLYRAALAEAPSFARTNDLSTALAELAQQQESRGSLDDALSTFRLARWLLEPESPQARRARALQLQAAVQAAHGREVVAAAQYKQILALDSSRSSARDWLEANDTQGFHSARAFSKTLKVSFIVFLAAMLVRGWLLSRRRRAEEDGSAA